jgi:hypothetical protein
MSLSVISFEQILKNSRACPVVPINFTQSARTGLLCPIFFYFGQLRVAEIFFHFFFIFVAKKTCPPRAGRPA